MRGKYQVLRVRVTNRVMVVAEGGKEVLIPLLLGETNKEKKAQARDYQLQCMNNTGALYLNSGTEGEGARERRKIMMQVRGRVNSV